MAFPSVAQFMVHASRMARLAETGGTDMTEHNRLEQCREIQRALIDYYIDRPRLRDDLYKACTAAFEALIEKERKQTE